MGKREFFAEFAALMRPAAQGRRGVDVRELDALVRADAEGARDTVDHLLREAWSTEGHLQLAFVIAAALAHATADRSALQRVLEQAQKMGAVDELQRLTIVPPNQVPSESSPERSKAREWWQGRPLDASAVCDECSEPLARGDGFLVAGRPREFRGVVLNLSDDLICRVCFERRIARG